LTYFKKRIFLSNVWAASLVLLLSLTAHALENSSSSPQQADSSKPDLAEIGAKLSDPLSDLWALFTQFGFTLSDGSLNAGKPKKAAGNIIFEPIIPIPLYGEGNKAWKLILRPTLPLILEQPLPTGGNRFNHKTGLSDMLFPMIVGIPAGNILLGLGPTFTFPTATQREFGRKQLAMGPACVLGYRSERILLGVFPQYFWKVASTSQGNIPDANYMSLIYFFVYNLPDAWEIATNPTVSYDHNASSGNQWNVPVGLGVAKTISIGNMPVKVQLAVEYSVVSEKDFGKRFQLKLNVIPVVQSLVTKPILGGVD